MLCGLDWFELISYCSPSNCDHKLTPANKSNQPLSNIIILLWTYITQAGIFYATHEIKQYIHSTNSQDCNVTQERATTSNKMT